MQITKSLNTIVDNLEELFAGGNYSDDYIPSRRQLKWIVLNWRATNIRRDLDKNNIYYDSIRQDLGLVPLIRVDKSECPDTPSGCFISRTVTQIPTPLRLKTGEDIQVFDIQKINALNQILPEELATITNRKFTGKNVYWFKRNGYIYVTGSLKARMIKEINIRGSFENPFAAGNFGCITGDCFNDDSEFPIPMDMLPLLTQAIISSEFKMKEIPTNPDTNTSK